MNDVNFIIITVVFSLFKKGCVSKTKIFQSKKDKFLTYFWAPLDLKNAINTNAFLSILPLQKDDILERF